MKCIQCGTDNNLKDRTANRGRCSMCNHRFVFEPTSMGNVKITDPLFAKAIADISGNNTLFFTRKQFFYLLDKRLGRKIIPFSGAFSVGFLFFIIAVFGGIGLANSSAPATAANIITGLFTIAILSTAVASFNSVNVKSHIRRFRARFLQTYGVVTLVSGIFFSVVIFDSSIMYLMSVLLGMSSIFLGRRQLKRQRDLPEPLFIEKQQFQSWMMRWTQINGPISKILPSPREENTAATVNPDITAYSFDRLVVCDSPTIAQLLIANNFHFENNCAVLSITGYPQSIFDTTMQMLRRNPDLKVYALHDCSPHGIGLVHHLRTSANWFANSNVMIFDVGLLPRQIFASPNVFIQASEESAQAAKQLPAAIRQDLSNTELKWLEAGKFVELESFTPQKLIQVLNRGIGGSRNLDDDSSLILVGDTGFVYASDSFG